MKALVLLALGVAVPVAAIAATPAATPDVPADYCAQAQQWLAGTKLVATNRRYTDFEAFKESKPGGKPLYTEQYVTYDGRNALRVSCKMKTPDHLNALYGAGTATATATSCADLNRRTVTLVYGSLSAAERKRARIAQARVRIDADESVVVGPSWLKEFPFVYAGDGGALHLRAKRLRIDWEDFWWSWAPDSVRGTYYCHVIAPSYLKRLILGEAPVPEAT